MSIALSNERYEEIKRTVVDLFEESTICCTPISGYEIAVKLGIKVIPYSALPLSKRQTAVSVCPDGFSGYDNGEWRICVNDAGDVPYGRVNFTILHEIAHIVLNHTEDSELAEAEADFFAKFAQCPPVLIQKLGLTDVGGIMDHFYISYGAACYALTYYQKWLRYSGTTYKDYELRTCKLFGFAPQEGDCRLQPGQN